MNHQINVYDRESDKKFIEKVYGGKWIEFFYTHKLGKLLEFIISLPIISKIYGAVQDSKFSASKVKPFIEKFNINMNEFEKSEFESFNDFFIRKFKPGVREFINNPDSMPAFCEARYFGFDKIDNDIKFPVKGKFLQAKDLLGDHHETKYFKGGPLIIARLCPVDYHCYHYPDSGRTLKVFEEGYKLHSVNPLALKSIGSLFGENKRRVSVLETENFGKLAYIEVGATCVGKIIQAHDESKDFMRGDYKGHFLFGGSTVILIGEPGKWRPSQDILDNSSKGLETYLKLGVELALSS